MKASDNSKKKGSFRVIFGQRGSRVWFIVTVILLAFLIVANSVIYTMLSDVFSSVFGGERPDFDRNVAPAYTTEYEGKEDVLAAANALNERIAEEGFVLLKNEDDALPLYTPLSNDESNRPSENPKISIFGKNSVNPVYGGSGSGGGSGEGATSIYTSLRNAGYDVNEALEEFYESSASGATRPATPEGSNLDDGVTVGISTYETPVSSYSASLKESFAEYNDAAVVVISRMGGEGFDLPRVMSGTSGARDREDPDHYLQLDQNEADLLAMVCDSGFDRVILVLNVGTTFELGFIEDGKDEVYNALKGYSFDAEKIDAAIWTGFPGNSGFAALGRIFNGNVSPSGRTTDTWSMDFKQDPSWMNFGDNRTADGNQYIMNGTPQSYYFVDYEEGIYVGYRYYETRGVVEAQAGDEGWYGEHVVYPFGYGLSYAQFEWEVTDASSIAGVDISAHPQDEIYTITVNVTNTSDIAGKEVVELYGHAPWDEWTDLEKAETVLLDFAKTDLLEPGASQEVTLTFDPYYLASFDYDDGNYNSFYGYELEALDGYELRIGKNAHETVETIGFEVNTPILYENDPTTGNPVKVRFSGNENAYLNSDLGLASVMSRYDFSGTFPTTPTQQDRTVEPGMIEAIEDRSHNNPNDYSGVEIGTFDQEGEIRFRDLITGPDGSHEYVAYADDRFEALIDQCSAQELLDMVNYGAFKTNGLLDIGKPLTNDTDGPAGFVNFMLVDGTYYDTCYYASQMTIASTWNKQLAEEFGAMVGDEGIIGADGKGNGMAYSGWYAPGANIHRSPFGGRNFEYMSEDGVLTGKMAAAQIRGCKSKGVYCFMKHFAVNDQETRRSIGGLVTWLTEQSLREIYLRPFEIAVKEGGTRAMMSSFNRIGTKWTGGDYRLLTDVLRDEWGFNGIVITDFTSGPYQNARQMMYAGGSLNLNNQAQFAWTDFDISNPGDVAVLRRATHDIFYTVVNSNAMNYEITGYAMPVWSVFVIIVDVVAIIALAVWGFFSIRSALKKAKQTGTKEVNV